MTIYRHEGRVGRRLETRDSAMRDILLTTSNRLTAEPGPILKKGDLGVQHDGNGMTLKDQIDNDVETFKKHVSTLSPAERAKLMADLGKLSGRAPSVVTPLGISHHDASSGNRARADRDATNVVIAKINADNRAFWETRS
jgi:hypothetical protein